MHDHPAPDYKNLGVEIARRRRSQGWSIERLATESHVSRKSVINIEAARHEAQVTTLWRIAHGLGMPLGDLVKALYGPNENRGQVGDR